jgi:ATP-binding cassette subfamily F protein 3
MHLLSHVADTLWLVDGGGVSVWRDDLEAYRRHLLSEDKPVERPPAVAPPRPSREALNGLRSEVRRCEARVGKIEEMRDRLAKKLADPALYEPGRVGELEVWNRKYAEVMDGLEKAEALWLAAQERLEAAAS